MGFVGNVSCTPIGTNSTSANVTTSAIGVIGVGTISNASITNTNPVQSMVWIANEKAKIYHDDKECSNMKSPIQITLQEAQERGLKPCEKCVN